MLAILSDSELARRLGNQGLQDALTHYSWKRVVEQTLDLYNQVKEQN